MPHPDFEAYLALLSRFLRLSPAQREEIRRELRAHLEEAIEDEMARGVPREEAILKALDDFGDAAELAARFGNIGRARRWIMRGTLAAACIGFMVLTVNFLSPATRPVAAQSQQAAGGKLDTLGALGYAGAPAGDARKTGTAKGAGDSLDSLAYANSPTSHVQKTGTSKEPSGDEAIEAALRKTQADASFTDVPFEQVVDYLRELLKVNIHVQWSKLEEAGVNRDQTVNVKLKNVSAERLLRLILEEISPDAKLAYEAQDGILIISTRDALNRRIVTRMYDVRGFLTAAHQWRAQVEALQTADSQRKRAEAENALSDTQKKLDTAKESMDKAKATVGQCGNLRLGGPATPEEELLQVMYEVVQPDSWRVTGGGNGNAQLFNGILVVYQTESVQREIEQFLHDLKKAGADQVAGAEPAAGAGQANASGASGPR